MTVAAADGAVRDEAAGAPRPSPSGAERLQLTLADGQRIELYRVPALIDTTELIRRFPYHRMMRIERTRTGWRYLCACGRRPHTAFGRARRHAAECFMADQVPPPYEQVLSELGAAEEQALINGVAET